MKLIILLTIVAVALADSFYGDAKYEKLDIEEIVKDVPLLRAFVVCFTDNSTCDQQTKEFKDDFPDILKTACAKCTPLQQHVVRRFLEGAAIHCKPEVAALLAKLDPERAQLPKLKAAIANA